MSPASLRQTKHAFAYDKASTAEPYLVIAKLDLELARTSRFGSLSNANEPVFREMDIA